MSIHRTPKFALQSLISSRKRNTFAFDIIPVIPFDIEYYDSDNDNYEYDYYDNSKETTKHSMSLPIDVPIPHILSSLYSEEFINLNSDIATNHPDYCNTNILSEPPLLCNTDSKVEVLEYDANLPVVPNKNIGSTSWVDDAENLSFVISCQSDKEIVCNESKLDMCNAGKNSFEDFQIFDSLSFYSDDIVKKSKEFVVDFDQVSNLNCIESTLVSWFDADFYYKENYFVGNNIDEIIKKFNNNNDNNKDYEYYDEWLSECDDNETLCGDCYSSVTITEDTNAKFFQNYKKDEMYSIGLHLNLNNIAQHFDTNFEPTALTWYDSDGGFDDMNSNDSNNYNKPESINISKRLSTFESGETVGVEYLCTELTKSYTASQRLHFTMMVIDPAYEEVMSMYSTCSKIKKPPLL